MTVLVRHLKFAYGGPVDIAEVYSPPRVTTAAPKYRLLPGEAFNLTNGCNFNRSKDHAAAEAYIVEREPLLLIGSPLCTMFSSLQNLNKWTAEKYVKLEEGKRQNIWRPLLQSLRLDASHLRWRVMSRTIRHLLTNPRLE